MPPFRYREEETSVGGIVAGVALGALAGFAVGVVVAQRVGGISALTSGLSARLRDRFGGNEGDLDEDALEDDEIKGDGSDDPLEEQVLAAYRQDPILSERAVDIGAIGDGIVELAGWVNTDEEAEHAVAVARAVEGVDTVVNRLSIGEEEELFEETVRRVERGDDALTEAQWEGQRVGTGRRRQGNSSEPDRHADPRTTLEERWLREDKAIKESAEESAELPGRRARGKRTHRGGRTDGSPVAPTGVPKADHVADPHSASESAKEPRAD
ncbi:MAG: BON domain-containing protein [Gemmatimonadota bacterium]|nr:BON domain-containing protein [Gemmatimonadota bacterium]